MSVGLVPEPTDEQRMMVETVVRSSGRSEDEAVRRAIVRTHIEDTARRALNRRVAAVSQADPARASAFASYGKPAAGTFDPIRAQTALEIAEQDATTWPDAADTDPAALAFLTGRYMAIAGGTNEVQRYTIGERVLGLPREPSFDTRRPFRDVVRSARDWTGTVG